MQDPQQEIGDNQLLKEAQGGDAEAFGLLYERYFLAIFRFLYAHLDSCLDAEDLAEEVFLRAWKALPGYHERGLPFSAFLFRIAHNVLIDHYRSSRRSETDLTVEEAFLPDYDSDPGDLAVTNLEGREIRRMMEQLREDYRTVLLARFISGLSPEETAQAMGKSVGAVRVLQHRALAALKKLMV
ncbi:MAG: RNA polymerase sigma factor [Omnitrophica WOR_2 bacterium]